MANNPIPLFSLVRVDVLEDHDDPGGYDAGADQLQYHDEVRLTSPGGEPCATPVAQGHDDLDVIYPYLDGSEGRTPLLRRHKIELACDFMREGVRGRLLQWMQERAEVYFTPGFGRHTECALRPLPGSGDYFRDGTTALLDLTGKHAVTYEQTGTGEHYAWDRWRKLLRGPYTTGRLVQATPWGAGQFTPGLLTNRWNPGAPESATAGSGTGTAGWYTGGTNAADLSLSLNADSLGLTDAPDCLLVYGSRSASRDRYLYQSHAWDSTHADYQGYTFTGAGSVTVTAWVRGDPGAGASLRLIHGVATAVTSLDALDLGDFYPVQVTLYAADWSTNVPQVRLDLSTGTDAEGCNLEVGPVFITAPQIGGPGLCWQLPAAGAMSACYMLATTSVTPKAGSIAVSWLQPTEALISQQAGQVFGLMCDTTIGLPQVGLRLRVIAGPAWQLEGPHQYEGSGTAALTATVTPVAGRPNSAALVWGYGRTALFFNGELVAEDDSALIDISVSAPGAGNPLWFGRCGTAYAGPLMMLTGRLDREIWTDDEACHITRSLIDTVALSTIVAARGRKYVIEEIPSTVRNAGPSGTQWIGRLVLRQVGYDHNAADLQSQEVE